MARNTVVKNERYPVASESDPLAELSRIMGLDSSGARAPHDEVDFGIDLEKELFGDFEAANSSSDVEDADIDALFDELALQDELPAAGEGDELDFAFDASDFDVVEEVVQLEVADQVVAEAAPVFDAAAGYAEEVELSVDQLALGRGEPAVEYRAEIADVDQFDIEAAAPIVEAAVSDAAALSFEDELDELLGGSAPAASPAYVMQPATEPSTVDAIEFDDLEFDEPLVDVDVDVAGQIQGEADVAPDHVGVDVEMRFEPIVDDLPAIEDEIDFGLEEELTAGTQFPNDATVGAAQADAAQDELDAAIAELEDDGGWGAPVANEPVAAVAAERVVETVEPPRSRFSFIQPEPSPVAAPEPPELADDPFAALAAMAAAPPILRTLRRSNPVAVNPEPARPAAEASTYTTVAPAPVARTYAPAPSVTPAAVAPVAAAAGSIYSRSQPVETPAVPSVAAEPEFDVADFDLELDGADVEAFAAETQDWRIKPSIDYETASRPVEYAPEQAIVEDEFSAAFDIADQHADDLATADMDGLLADDFVTELETVEVPDNVVAVADDLDLPELQMSEEPKPVDFDDFDADFADAFRQLGDAKRPVVAAAAASTVAPSIKSSQRVADEMLDADFAAFQRDFEANANAFDESEDFDFEPSSDRVDAQQRSRLPLYGAIFAGLLLFAGAGAYAFGMFGSSDADVPALVRADATPVKVKPETPGGVVVPNQDGQVYERVAGVDPKAHAQEKLVSKVEEPIAPQAKPAGDPLAGVDTNPIKSAERVVPEEASDGPLEQAAGIAPRKVRTMVVRPDGTLAPRPEPVVAPVAEAPVAAVVEPVVAQPAPEAAQPVEVAAAAPEPVAPAPAAPEPAAVEPVVAPKPVKTTTIKPKPAPEPEPQQVAAAPEPAPVDMAGGAAAATAPAAAGQLWNVQIASQPTREGAQSSYESLARKYGGVIGGKGVNIVQANIEGKGTMWRVRIPAASKNDANILCAKLKTAGGSCFVSR